MTDQTPTPEDDQPANRPAEDSATQSPEDARDIGQDEDSGDTLPADDVDAEADDFESDEFPEDTPEGDDEPLGEDDANVGPPLATLAAPADDGIRTGDRIAKVMARAGVASRRDAERMILEGRVKVNGATIKSPALDVLPSDRIVVDGNPLEAPQETRVWLYYKPVGLVTSEADEKGRQTIFDALPRDLPRVMTVGRLDLTSEGLLLLTNDGELKRRLELPATAWMRKYRVRVNGQPNELTFGPLRRGIEIEGEQFQPMEVDIDSQQGANAWLTVGIREGKNREIRRAMAHVGLTVNRLIRIGYGPFRLTGLEKNEVREVKRRVLRDQLGGLLTGEADADAAPARHGAERRFGRDDSRGGRENRGGPRGDREGADRPPRAFGDRPGKPRFERDGGGEGRERRPYGPRPQQGDGSRPDRPKRPDQGDRKPRAGGGQGGPRPWQAEGARPDRPRRSDDGDRNPRERSGPGQGGDRPWQGGARPDRPRRLDDGDRKPRERSGFGQGGDRPLQGHGARPDRPRRFDDSKPRRFDDSKPRRFDDAKPRRFDDSKPRERSAPGQGGFRAGQGDADRSGGKPWQADRPRRDGQAGGEGRQADAPRKPRWGADRQGQGGGHDARRDGADAGERPRQGGKPFGPRSEAGGKPNADGLRGPRGFGKLRDESRGNDRSDRGGDRASSGWQGRGGDGPRGQAERPARGPSGGPKPRWSTDGAKPARGPGAGGKPPRGPRPPRPRD